MSLNFNKGLFDAFGAGSGFQSATTGKATAANSQANQLILRLNNYLPSDPPPVIPSTEILPDESKVRNCQIALGNYGQGANNLNAHVSARLDTLINDMQVASAVKEVDSYISNVPASCTNINTIAGTLDGTTDSLLEAASTSMDELDQGITNYDANILSLEEFEALLDKVTAELASSLAGIVGMISNEVIMLDKMYKQHMQMAKSMGFSALLDDPCVRPLLVGLANPEITQVLLSDFEVGDLLERK